MRITVNFFKADYYESDYSVDGYFSNVIKYKSLIVDADKNAIISELKNIESDYFSSDSFTLNENRTNNAKEFILYDNENKIIWDYDDEKYTISEYFKIFNIRDNSINFVNPSETGGDLGYLELFEAINHIFENANNLANTYPIIYDVIKAVVPVLLVSRFKKNDFINNLLSQGASFKKLVSFFDKNEVFELDKLKKVLKTDDTELVISLLTAFGFEKHKNVVYKKIIKKKEQ